MYQTSILQIATLTCVFVGAVVGDVHSQRSRERTDTMRLSYSDHLAFNVTVTPTLLMFYPANGTSKGIELWSSNKPSKSEVWCDPMWARYDCRCQHTDYECRWFVMIKDGFYHFWKSMVTQKDQGMYEVRGERSRLIYKFQVFVQVRNTSRTVNASQDVDIWFVRFVRMYDLTFHPKDEPQSITELVKKGVVLSDRVNVKPDQLTIKSNWDSGTYQAFDAEGYLFLNLEVTVIYDNFTKPALEMLWSLWWFVSRVVPMFFAACFAGTFLLVCLAKCCSSAADKGQQTTTYVLPEFRTEEESMQHRPPSQPTFTSDDSCPPRNEQIQHQDVSEDPGLEDEGPTDTMPSGPTFEMEDFLNAQVPLSPSAPTSDVYTSDKLNFL